MVGDNADIGFSAKISIAGMTIIGAAPTDADTFTSGVKTYKFRVDQDEGSFVGQVAVDAITDDTVKTVQYSIKKAGSSVTNEEVLKSIVALIASINKQIRALQKLILRR
jgi:folate-dependent phosphoribosylglycinamide formyltransferase PurN